jgi:integrase
MAKEILSEDQVQTKIVGRYKDCDTGDYGGGTLVLEVRTGSAVYWFEYNSALVGLSGSRRTSVGARKKTTLRKARLRAELNQTLLEQGIDPKDNWKSYEKKAVLQQRPNMKLTVGHAFDGRKVEGRPELDFMGFLEWAEGRRWKREQSISHAKSFVKNYFRGSKLWHMAVEDIRAKHAAEFLDPWWRSKAPTAKRLQSLGFMLFKFLNARDLYPFANPFDGKRDGRMIELLGGPQPPANNWKEADADDLPLVMAQLRKHRIFGDKEWTAAEVAEACEVDTHAIILGCKGRGKYPPIFPNAYRWAPWRVAPWIIPEKDLNTPLARRNFPLKRPLRHLNEISIVDLAVQMVIMTALRTRMVCELREEYINERNGRITFPKGAHKTGEQGNDSYSALLTPQLMDIINQARAYKTRRGILSPYMFVIGQNRFGLSVWKDQLVKRAAIWRRFRTVLARTPGIHKRDATIHGVREAFITWASNRLPLLDPMVLDVIIGHKVGKVKNPSYWKNAKFLAHVKDIVPRWHKFLLKVPPHSVEPIPYKSEPVPIDENGKQVRPWQIARGEAKEAQHARASSQSGAGSTVARNHPARGTGNRARSHKSLRANQSKRTRRGKKRQ